MLSGFIFGFCANIAGISVIYWIYPPLLQGLGLIQLLWMAPLCVFVQKKEPNASVGVAIAASLTFILNVTCYVASYGV